VARFGEEAQQKAAEAVVHVQADAASLGGGSFGGRFNGHIRGLVVVVGGVFCMDAVKTPAR
jgi:uncharacterized protein YbjQ (UPF0145 family)